MLKIKKQPDVLIVLKPENADAARLGHDIHAWLSDRGCRPRLLENRIDTLPKDSPRPDLVLVLGGDGTMLEVARYFVDSPMPLVGIKFGKVGFLTELKAQHWKKGLQAMLDGKMTLLKRMAVHYQILRQGDSVHQGYAVNDVVLNRGALARVISFYLSADEQEIGHVRADGLIISTPMGATGYAVSAGGPLIHPELDSILITPISPFLCNFPPLILPQYMNVFVTVNPETADAHLTIDGQLGMPLERGDVLSIRSVSDGVHFARMNADAYFMRLRGRGFIQEYSGLDNILL